MDYNTYIGGIQKFSTDDGPGIRTTVFLKGCPLHCRWCHNPELISFSQEVIRMPNSCIGCGNCRKVCPKQAVYVREDHKPDIRRDRCDLCLQCVAGCYAEGLKAVGKRMSPDEVLTEVAKDIGFYRETGGGMTISGGEVLSHPRYAKELIEGAADLGINVCLDTSGEGRTEDLMMLASYPNVTDILYDMKALDPQLHEELTGLSNERILENLIVLSEREELRRKIHMRMPLIRCLNDDPDMLQRTAWFYREHRLPRVTLLPYHSLGVSKADHVGKQQEQFAPPEDAVLEDIRQMFETVGQMQAEVSGFGNA